jgi:hypothetical protein
LTVLPVIEKPPDSADEFRWNSIKSEDSLQPFISQAFPDPQDW